MAVAEEEVSSPKIDRYLRISGILMISGLLVEAASLYWAHPTAFLVFMFIGGTLMGIGILVFLWSLVSRQ
jgi:hypothetical protein